MIGGLHPSRQRILSVNRHQRHKLARAYPPGSPRVPKIRSRTPPLPVSLPFGLATTPRVFTKVLTPLLANLRAQGIPVMAYLDDLLLVEQSVTQLNHSVLSTVKYLEQLGWVLNLQKSSLQPLRPRTLDRIHPRKNLSGSVSADRFYGVYIPADIYPRKFPNSSR